MFRSNRAVCIARNAHTIFTSGFLLLWVISSHAQTGGQQQRFISELDNMRTGLKIPGMSVAVQQNGVTILQHGLGYADLKNQIPVTPKTAFGVASITKTFASTIIMQLAEKGMLRLDDSVSKYGIDFGNANITIRHLLTHTSEGEPGTHYQYNGYRYGRLTQVVENAAGIPFYQLIMQNIIEPAGMTSSAPGINLYTYINYAKKHKEIRLFFERTFAALAKPYAVNDRGEIVESYYLDEFGTFGGLRTTTGDLLKYSRAIDKHQFLRKETQDKIFSPNKTKDGKPTPYGLGWFSQQYLGVKYYWHYGQTQGESGLFVKVPSKALTFVVLANSDRLSTPFPLGDGDLFTSPAGQLFYKYFINSDEKFPDIDYTKPANDIKALMNPSSEYLDFYNKVLVTQAAICNAHGDTTRAKQFYSVYAELNFRDVPSPRSHLVASLANVGINKDLTKEFSVDYDDTLNIVGIGENCSADYTSWCDYGWIEDSNGRILWQMQSQPAAHAGGAQKNQQVIAMIALPAGHYKLRYKSDAGHAFDNWDSAPPDHYVWGIMLYKK